VVTGRAAVLVTALLVGVLALALLPRTVFAQQSGGLELDVRDTRLQPDGGTEVVVRVSGPAVPDVLDPEMFRVAEQGEPVEELGVQPYLRSAGGDVAVGVAVDLSGSMRGEAMDVTKRAVADLSETLVAAGASVQLTTFASEIVVATPLTDDLDILLAAVDDMEAGGATPLYDGIITASEELAGTTAQRNLIVFSDGGDTNSAASLGDAIASINDTEADATIVALDTDDLDPQALDELAAGSDGRVLTADDLDALADAFSEVAREIASQYLLSYTSARVEPETLDLTVEVEVGGEQATTTFAVQNLRDPGPTAPTVVAPSTSPFANPAYLVAGLLAAFVALLLILGTIFAGTRSRAEKVLDEQLARYIGGGDVRAGRSSLVATHFRERAIEVFESGPRPTGFDDRLTRSLERAAWPMRNGEFLLLIVGLGLGAGLLFGLLFNPLGGILVGMVAASLPILVLQRKARKRHDEFLALLPDTLQLMAGSLRAGYGVMQAIDAVAKESTGVTGEEFGRVLTEARLGMPLDQALTDMADRLEDDDFRWVVLAMNIQREVGGNLAELLDTVAEVLREREMLRRQIKVLSAEGRLSAIILVGLPVVLAIYLILVRPEYISVLVTSGAFGWLLVISAIFLMMVGVIWIRNLVKIEV
jgi:tight adherence protein B